VQERVSVICIAAAESDFVALPMNLQQLKVSFALQKIPLTMKLRDISSR
jgi:hypothetical protein